jgi:hypothetical protein
VRAIETESEIQRRIIEAAELAGCIVWRMNAGRGRNNQRLARAGTPDLLLLTADGRYVWVEVKTQTGRLNPDQVNMHMALSARQATVITARLVQDVIDEITRGGNGSTR